MEGSMKLIFVHGMRQEGKDPEALRVAWRDALIRGWEKLGLNELPIDPVMPFYGDVLENLTAEVRSGSSKVIARGVAGEEGFTSVEERLIRQMADKAGITDAEIRTELSAEIVARGPANWEWVQAIGRALEARVPMLGKIGLGFVSQVDSYLTRPHISDAVNAIVAKAFGDEPAVIVSHSLGTIVTYRIMCQKIATPPVPLFVTVGSPLGIRTVQSYLKPPSLGRPNNVKRWVNGTDERDYVALVARLDADTFAPNIENNSDIHNRQEDAHFIEDYLTDPMIARTLHEALA
jgi:hypothetical protein